MSELAFIKKKTLSDIGDALREKTEATPDVKYLPSAMPEIIRSITTGFDISDTTLEASGQMLSGVKAHKANGELVTGSIPTKGVEDLKTSGASVTVPPGYYPQEVVGVGDISFEDPVTMSVDSTTGKVSYSQYSSAGYIGDRTIEGDYQLPANPGGLITPTAAGGKIVSKGKYLLGDITLPSEPDLNGSYILSGHNIYGVDGKIQKITSIPAPDIIYEKIPGDAGVKIETNIGLSSAGYYASGLTNSNSLEVSNIRSGNIKNNVTILGVTGNLVAPVVEDIFKSDIAIISNGRYDSSFRIRTLNKVASIRSLTLALSLRAVGFSSEFIVMLQYDGGRSASGIIRYSNDYDEMGGSDQSYDVSIESNFINLKYTGISSFEYGSIYEAYGTVAYEES